MTTASGSPLPPFDSRSWPTLLLEKSPERSESKDHPYYQCSRFFNSKNGARINGREVEMSFTSTAKHTAPDDLGGTYSRGRVSRMASGWYGSRL